MQINMPCILVHGILGIGLRNCGLFVVADPVYRIGKIIGYE